MLWLPLFAMAFSQWLSNDLKFPSDLDEPVPTKTVVDVLSEHAEFSTFVHLLQRFGLIPLLNTCSNITLFAPVNSAFDPGDHPTITKNTLLYYIANNTYNDTVLEGPRVIIPSYLQYHDRNIPIEVREGSINHGQAVIVEPDLWASPQRGVVHGISSLLEMPEPVCYEAFLRNEISLFAQVVSINELCNELGDNITLFLPLNEAMLNEFSDIEISYLFGAFSRPDRLQLLASHAVRGTLDPANLPETIEMMDGSIAHISDYNGDLWVNNTRMERNWLIGSNGVYFITNGLMNNPIQFTPEKYILALQGYPFVRRVRMYDHQDLIDGTVTTSQTIFVPEYSRQDGIEQPVGDSLAIESDASRVDSHDMILYQFVEGKVNLNMSGSYMLPSKLQLKSGKFPQRIHAQVHNTGKVYVNWQQVLSKEYTVNNCSIYVVDGSFQEPPNLQLAVGPLFLSSYSLAYLDDLDLLSLPYDHSWTLLLPTRDAWEKQILVKYYFDANPDALRRVFNRLIMKTPIYSNSLPQQVELLDGSEVGISVSKELERTAFNMDKMHFDTEITDILFDNGVVHCVSNIDIPQTIEITASDFISAGRRDEFIELLKSVDLAHVLQPGNGNYTILVPNIKTLKKDNITVDTPDLAALVKLHIIEGNPIQRLLDGEDIDTLAGEPVKMEPISERMWSIAPVYGEGQRIFVDGWGDTNGYTAAGSTVLFVDKYISPAWISPPILKPPFRMSSHIVLLVGIVLGLMVCGVIAVGAVYLFMDDKFLLDTAPLEREHRAEEREDADQEPQRTQPIPTNDSAPGREYGRHLDLP